MILILLQFTQLQFIDVKYPFHVHFIAHFQSHAPVHAVALAHFVER